MQLWRLISNLLTICVGMVSNVHILLVNTMVYQSLYKQYPSLLFMGVDAYYKSLCRHLDYLNFFSLSNIFYRCLCNQGYETACRHISYVQVYSYVKTECYAELTKSIKRSQILLSTSVHLRTLNRKQSRGDFCIYSCLIWMICPLKLSER